MAREKEGSEGSTGKKTNRIFLPVLLLGYETTWDNAPDSMDYLFGVFRVKQARGRSPFWRRLRVLPVGLDNKKKDDGKTKIKDGKAGGRGVRPNRTAGPIREERGGRGRPLLPDRGREGRVREAANEGLRMVAEASPA